MTISYSDRFARLLKRWKGSLWKTLFKDLFIYLAFYYVINIAMRLCLHGERRLQMLKTQFLFNEYTKQIPLTFLLGFYVGMVVKRWWEQFKFISWPDSLLSTVNAYVRGGETERRQRLTIARYCLLSAVLAWRSISARVFKRFPTDQHLIDAGLLTQEEKDFFEGIDVTYDPHQKWFVPLGWVHAIIVAAWRDGQMRHATELENVLHHLENYKNGFQELFLYDWVSIPLVYTQVATIAVYGYFGLCLIARQYPAWISVPPLDRLKTPNDDWLRQYEIDVYIPIFTILQFLFYVGWLKVGEDLMSPFGEDDEDFELNYMIDRHAEMSRMIVDTLFAKVPKNVNFQDLPEYPLPHTMASATVPYNGPKRHIQSLRVSAAEAMLATDSFLDLHEARASCTPKHLLCVCDVARAMTDCKGILADTDYADTHIDSDPYRRGRKPPEPTAEEYATIKEAASRKVATVVSANPSRDSPSPSFTVTVMRNHTV